MNALFASLAVCLSGWASVHAQKLNEIVLLGSHNSYHIAKQEELLPEWRYSHPSLTEQAETHGVRVFELDLQASDGDGDFVISHILQYDDLSNCPSLRNCSQELQTWSAANSDHAPLFIYVNVKVGPSLDEWTAIDALLVDVWGDSLLTPTELRGDAATLHEALITNGDWPLVDDVRGQVVYLFDRETYLDAVANPSAFVLYSLDGSGDNLPDSVFVGTEDVRGNNGQIRDAVRERITGGWMVRARTDNPEQFIFPAPTDEDFLDSYFDVFDQDDDNIVTVDEVLAILEATTGEEASPIITSGISTLVRGCTGTTNFTRDDGVCVRTQARTFGQSLPPRAADILTVTETEERRDATLAAGVHLLGTDHFVEGETETSGTYIMTLNDGCEFYLNPVAGTSCGAPPADFPTECMPLCIESQAPTDMPSDDDDTGGASMSLRASGIASVVALWVVLPLALVATLFC